MMDLPIPLHANFPHPDQHIPILVHPRIHLRPCRTNLARHLRSHTPASIRRVGIRVFVVRRSMFSSKVGGTFAGEGRFIVVGGGVGGGGQAGEVGEAVVMGEIVDGF